MAESSKSAHPRRQIVNFAFFRVQPEWRRLPIAERREHKEEAIRVLERWDCEDMRVLAYSTVGLRGDADFMLWRISYSLECLSAAHSDLLKTKLGGYLEPSHWFLGMTKRSQYLIGQEHESNQAYRSYIKAGGSKYLVIYPFSKTREWYLRPFEERQRVVTEQMKAAGEFPRVRMNTVYSIGVDDNEFVIALETDHLEDLVDMAMRLREVENSLHIQRDVPRLISMGVSIEQMLEKVG
ncbi:MAG: chlorite dismutase family protein [Terriglobales bacterium]